MGSVEAMAVDTESLLASSGWVRALARNLVIDAHRAEDLSQDAWVAALEGRPAKGVSLRRWIAGVMRNLARQSRRGELRRADRELAAARISEPTRTEPVADTLERLEAHRAVVEAVMGLHEPYRKTIVLRYFDGLEPRAIAEREQVPARTVHTRLTRGHAMLRARLERNLGHSSAGAWLPLIGLLLGPERHAGVLGTTLGAVLMDAKLKVTAGAVALAGLAIVSRPLWINAGPASMPVEASAATTALAPPEPVEASQAPVDVEGERTSVVAAPAAAAASMATPPEADRTLRARVIDIEGRPVAGIAVACRQHGGARGPSVFTDALGLAEVPARSADGSLETADERWVTVLEPIFWDTDFEDAKTLVVAPRITLAGMVVDESGIPLAEARLAVQLSWDFRWRLPLVLDGSRACDWGTESTTDGSFMLETAAIPGEFLSIRLVGYEPQGLPLPTASVLDLRIVLTSPGDAAGWVRGIVVDEQGLPVEGARVALGFEHTRSAADGSFGLQAKEHDPFGVLTALVLGKLPARLARRGDSSLAEDAWPDPVVLRLGGPPLTLSGRVLDAQGEAVSNASVSLLDPTHFGAVALNDSDQMTQAGFVEPMLDGGVSELAVRSGSDGRFELRGLLPRGYHLEVWLEQQGLYVQDGPFDAGRRDVVLRLPAEPLVPLLGGRVLCLAGQPIGGASVMVMRRRPKSELPTDVPMYEWLLGQTTYADDQGRFAFRDVSSAVTHLAVSGPTLGLPRHVEIPAGADLERLELHLPLRCHVLVDLTGSGIEADHFSLLDPSGTAMQLGSFYGDLAFSVEQINLREGRSEAVSAAEDGRTLVLYRHGSGEVLRIPVTLRAGELNVIKP